MQQPQFSTPPTAKRQRAGPCIVLTRKRANTTDVEDVRTRARVTTVALVEEAESCVQHMRVALPALLHAHGVDNTAKAILYRTHILARHFLQSSWMPAADLGLHADSTLTLFLSEHYDKLHRLVTSLRALCLVPEAHDLRPIESRISAIFNQLAALTNCCY
tara:strand:- start:69 stop:551 length:483 start_codon:yes stop_codon:yes gene_type:complete